MFNNADDFSDQPTPTEKLGNDIFLEVTVLMERHHVPPVVDQAETLMEKSVNGSKTLSKEDKDTVLAFEKGILRGDPEAVSKAQERIEALKRPRDDDTPDSLRERKERAENMEMQITRDLRLAGVKVKFGEGGAAVVAMDRGEPVSKTFFIRGGEVSTNAFELFPGKYGGALGSERDPAEKSADDRIGFMKMGRHGAKEYVKSNMARTIHSGFLEIEPIHGSWNRRPS